MTFNVLTFANFNFAECATGGFSGSCEPLKWGAGPNPLEV